LRAAIHGRYLIPFRDLDAEVRIVRIVHGARDLPGAVPALKLPLSTHPLC
jgi:plasmid stabilization system protein ParE